LAEERKATEVPTALAWGLIAKILVSVLAIVSNVIIVRSLGEHNYGVYSLFLNIARFLTIAIGLGLAQALLRYLPEMRVNKNGRGTRALLLQATGMQVASWGVVLMAVYFFRGWISTVFDTDLNEVLLLGTALLLFDVFWQFVSNIYRALRWMRAMTVVMVVQRVVLIGLLVLFSQTRVDFSGGGWTLETGGITIMEVLFAVAGSLLAGTLCFLPKVIRRLPWHRISTGDGIATSRVMKYALPTLGIGLINQVLWRSSETLIIGYYWTEADVGFFNLAYTLPQMILEFIPQAIRAIVLAFLAEAYTRKQDALNRGIGLYFRLICVLVIPLALSGYILGGNAYLLLYGESMAPGAPLCSAFFLVFVLSFLVAPFRMALFVKEKTMLNMWIIAIGAVVNIAFDFLLIPRYGIQGAVAPVALALLASGVVQIVACRRYVPEIKVEWHYLIKFLPGAALLIPFWYYRSRLAEPLPLLGAMAAMMVLQYLALRLCRAFGEEEREIILRSKLPFKQLITDLLVGRK
jgi:O-antigen/teichoic acid export membrane protein